MNLPPRLEGPHAWLWRLVYREAELLVSRSGVPGDTDEAAEWLWRGIVSGWIWVRRDRNRIIWDVPDPWLHELVSAEAARHLALSDTRVLQAAESEAAGEGATTTAPGPRRPRAERHAVIMGHIWRYLSTGWARVATEEDTILFWHPTRREFLPFSAELEADYRRLFRSLRNVGVQTERRLAGNQPYTGRRPARGVQDMPTAYTGHGGRTRRRPRSGESSPEGESQTGGQT